MNRMWKSFLPATKYDHHIAMDRLENGNIRMIVGGNRTMTAVVTPEVATEIMEHITELLKIPPVTTVPIEVGPPPRIVGISVVINKGFDVA